MGVVFGHTFGILVYFKMMLNVFETHFEKDFSFSYSLFYLCFNKILNFCI